MMLKPVQHPEGSDSESSYGSELRLKYRKQYSIYKNQEKTRRIPQGKKERLVTMVVKENYRIKQCQAGRILGISYSTAKKIFTNFRIELRAKKQPDTGEDQKHIICHYKEIKEQDWSRIGRVEVFSSIAGWKQDSLDNNLFNKSQ